MPGSLKTPGPIINFMSVALSSFAHNLSLLNWQLFGTLTFSHISPEKRMWSCAWLHFQRIARQTKTPYGALRIALRFERGEKTDRPHFHYLLGGVQWKNHVALAHLCEMEWRKRVGALTVVRSYDRDQSGAAYVAKCLAANRYERSKFDTADTVELSEAVFADMSKTRLSWSLPGLHTGKKQVGDESASGLSVGGNHIP